MTQEDKELLFKDLCARLPYGVIVVTPKGRGYVCNINLTIFDYELGVNINPIIRDPFSINDVKPYLFPLSSMTDEQAKEIQEITGNPDYACIIRKTDGLELWLNFIDTDPTIWLDAIFEVQDYLNKNHFDYRGLIEKGLAIDVTGLNIY